MTQESRPQSHSILAQLMAVIDERRRTRPEKSYTTRLFEGGLSAIGAKVREEAEEVVEAAAETDAGAHNHLAREAADLVYHMLVLLSFREVTFEEVEAELARRFGISGLDEKAARGGAPPRAS
jgi:phosphoribosyl-ATP pyrophosphohydrolase